MRGFILTAALGLAGLVACDDPGARGILVDDPLPAAAISLERHDGTRFELSAHRGKIVALFFGYTHCPDVCPTTLSDWAKARAALGERADRVQFVFVSLDPERDTPQKAHEYAQQFDTSFIGLTGSVAAIDSLKHAWAVPAWKEGDVEGGNYAVAHPGQTFVVDEQGRLAMYIEPGVPGEELARSLRRLF